MNVHTRDQKRSSVGNGIWHRRLLIPTVRSAPSARKEPFCFVRKSLRCVPLSSNAFKLRCIHLVTNSKQSPPEIIICSRFLFRIVPLSFGSIRFSRVDIPFMATHLRLLVPAAYHFHSRHQNIFIFNMRGNRTGRAGCAAPVQPTS